MCVCSVSSSLATWVMANRDPGHKLIDDKNYGSDGQFVLENGNAVAERACDVFNDENKLINNNEVHESGEVQSKKETSQNVVSSSHDNAAADGNFLVRISNKCLDESLEKCVPVSSVYVSADPTPVRLNGSRGSSGNNTLLLKIEDNGISNNPQNGDYEALKRSELCQNNSTSVKFKLCDWEESNSPSKKFSKSHTGNFESHSEHHEEQSSSDSSPGWKDSTKDGELAVASAAAPKFAASKDAFCDPVRVTGSCGWEREAQARHSSAALSNLDHCEPQEDDGSHIIDLCTRNIGGDFKHSNSAFSSATDPNLIPSHSHNNQSISSSKKPSFNHSYPNLSFDAVSSSVVSSSTDPFTPSDYNLEKIVSSNLEFTGVGKRSSEQEKEACVRISNLVTQSSLTHDDTKNIDYFKGISDYQNSFHDQKTEYEKRYNENYKDPVRPYECEINTKVCSVSDAALPCGSLEEESRLFASCGMRSDEQDAGLYEKLIPTNCIRSTQQTEPQNVSSKTPLSEDKNISNTLKGDLYENCSPFAEADLLFNKGTSKAYHNDNKDFSPTKKPRIQKEQSVEELLAAVEQLDQAVDHLCEMSSVEALSDPIFESEVFQPKAHEKNERTNTVPETENNSVTDTLREFSAIHELCQATSSASRFDEISGSEKINEEVISPDLITSTQEKPESNVNIVANAVRKLDPLVLSKEDLIPKDTSIVNEAINKNCNFLVLDSSLGLSKRNSFKRSFSADAESFCDSHDYCTDDDLEIGHDETQCHPDPIPSTSRSLEEGIDESDDRGLVNAVTNVVRRSLRRVKRLRNSFGRGRRGERDAKEGERKPIENSEESGERRSVPEDPVLGLPGVRSPSTTAILLPSIVASLSPRDDGIRGPDGFMPCIQTPRETLTPPPSPHHQRR